MDDISNVDYYEVLQCERTVTPDELKKNYQRLVLSYHPDKSINAETRFILIQKAWSVLRDPESRKRYDASLTCQEHSNVLLYDTIMLSDMTYSDEEKVYTYVCRCGGTYLLDSCNPIPSKVIIACDECSFSIEVNNTTKLVKCVK